MDGENTEPLKEYPGSIFDDSWLLEDLGVMLESIEQQIKEVEEEAEKMGIPSKKLRTEGGDWPLRSLLLAKAHTINAMVLMKSMEDRVQIIFNQYNASDQER